MESNEDTIFKAVGRRKTSIARVRLSKGKGTITINKKEHGKYFDRKVHTMDILKPLELTDSMDRYDLSITVKGGGKTGQSGAVRHGISRALLLVDPSNRGTLKRNGFLTRDSRMVERKKYGQKGARKSFQFSKR